MVSLMSDKNRQNKKNSLQSSIILVYIVAMIFVSVFVLPRYELGYIIWLVMAAIALYIVKKKNSSSFAFICKNCSFNFTITTLQDIFSSRKLDTKFLKCPKCGKKTWAKETIKK